MISMKPWQAPSSSNHFVSNNKSWLGVPLDSFIKTLHEAKLESERARIFSGF